MFHRIYDREGLAEFFYSWSARYAQICTVCPFNLNKDSCSRFMVESERLHAAAVACQVSENPMSSPEVYAARGLFEIRFGLPTERELETLDRETKVETVEEFACAPNV